MEAFSAAPLMAFCHDLVGSRLAFFGVAAFTMQANYDYRGSWHRDSYAAWGKDSEKERPDELGGNFSRCRTIETQGRFRRAVRFACDSPGSETSGLRTAISLSCLWHPCGSQRFCDNRLGAGSRLQKPGLPRLAPCRPEARGKNDVRSRCRFILKLCRL